MTIDIRHFFVSAKVDSLDTSRVQPSNWNEALVLKTGPAVVIGRDAAAGAGQAAATEIPMGVTGQALLATATQAAAKAVIGASTAADIVAASTKNPPVDVDSFAIVDVAGGNVLKRVTWANIKALLKTYFDGLYPSNGNGIFSGFISAGNGIFSGSVTAAGGFISSGINIVLATTGAGGIFLRPNGVASALGQTTINAAGDMSVLGAINSGIGGFTRLGVALPFTKAFESAQQTIVSGGALTLPHGLGVHPKLMAFALKCQTAEGGYSIGDESQIPPSLSQEGTGVARGVVCVPDITNLNLRIGISGLNLMNKSSGNYFQITTANWKLIARAWA